jgi:HEAT repeat protein
MMSISGRQENIDELLKSANSWNGFERERAVKQLGVIGDISALPLFIKRANDWVPQVRTAAYKALESLLVERNASVFIEMLPNIYHLENCQRDEHRNLIEAIELFLLRTENQTKLIDGCTNLNPLVARRCLKLSIEHQLLHPHQIVLRCIKNPDVVVRSFAANLCKLLTDNELQEFIEFGLKDPFMPVRREIFLLYLSRFPNNSVSLLENFAFDRHSSVREIAVKQLVDIRANVRNLYLQELSKNKGKPSRLRSALLGLSEINATDTLTINTISKYYLSSSPSLRKASLQALVRLNPEEAEQYLMVGLRDVSSSIVRQSARLMKKARIRLSESELMDLYLTNTSEVMMSCVLSLNRFRNKWDRIVFLLWIARSSNSVDSLPRVETEIKKWIHGYNHSFVTLSRSQSEILNSRICELSEYKYQNILTCLKPYL